MHDVGEAGAGLGTQLDNAAIEMTRQNQEILQNSGNVKICTNTHQMHPFAAVAKSMSSLK